jgi:hypothetical protein
VTPVPDAPPSLLAELEPIRRARSSVLAADGKSALVELDAYVAAHPHGTFEEEALALRVRALRMLGDAAGASSTFDDLKTRFPRSVQLGALAPEGVGL